MTQNSFRACKEDGALASEVRVAAVAFISFALLLSGGCSPKQVQGDAVQTRKAMAIPVTVAKVERRTVPIELHVIGNGEAYSTVNVKSLVQGEVQHVNFVDGQDVRKGDVLFSIDPGPFQAMLAQAQGNLAHDQAQEQNALAQEQRNTELFKSGIISKDQYDQFRTNAQALQAAVKADEAAVENARLQLGYCTIRSPLDGRTGAVLVDQGNLVKANDVPMVVINQITPIYVDFSAPQQYLTEIKTYQARQKLRVQATVAGHENEPEWGTLSFINNAVDATTGTILLKGTFQNARRRLWPGQYVNVTLRLSDVANATVAPTQAIQTGQQGQYVFVVKADSTAELRPVTTGVAYQGFTVVEMGLQPGETVVTDGQLMLAPGATVEVKKP